MNRCPGVSYTVCTCWWMCRTVMYVPAYDMLKCKEYALNIFRIYKCYYVLSPCTWIFSDQNFIDIIWNVCVIACIRTRLAYRRPSVTNLGLGLWLPRQVLGLFLHSHPHWSHFIICYAIFQCSQHIILSATVTYSIWSYRLYNITECSPGKYYIM
jgi:hypothetical protein